MILLSTVNTQSSSGMSECYFLYPTTNITISVPNGIVCFGCVIEDELAYNATFQIAGYETVFEPDGILTVFSAEDVFNTNTGTVVQCSSGNNTASVTVFLESKLHVFCYFFRVLKP